MSRERHWSNGSSVSNWNNYSYGTVYCATSSPVMFPCTSDAGYYSPVIELVSSDNTRVSRRASRLGSRCRYCGVRYIEEEDRYCVACGAPT